MDDSTSSTLFHFWFLSLLRRIDDEFPFFFALLDEEIMSVVQAVFWNRSNWHLADMWTKAECFRIIKRQCRILNLAPNPFSATKQQKIEVKPILYCVQWKFVNFVQWKPVQRLNIALWRCIQIESCMIRATHTQAVDPLSYQQQAREMCFMRTTGERK